MSMEDSEILALAAKAVGIDTSTATLNFVDAKVDAKGVWRPGGYWNPLTDDGDALRLAVKLRIDFEYDDNKVVAWFAAPRPGWDNEQVWSWTEPLGDDAYAATRRAIVQAAADIGKSIVALTRQSAGLPG